MVLTGCVVLYVLRNISGNCVDFSSNDPEKHIWRRLFVRCRNHLADKLGYGSSAVHRFLLPSDRDVVFVSILIGFDNMLQEQEAELMV